MLQKAHQRALDSADAALAGERKARAYDTAQAEQRTMRMMNKQQLVWFIIFKLYGRLHINPAISDWITKLFLVWLFSTWLPQFLFRYCFAKRSQKRQILHK